MQDWFSSIGLKLDEIKLSSVVDETQAALA